MFETSDLAKRDDAGLVEALRLANRAKAVAESGIVEVLGEMYDRWPVEFAVAEAATALHMTKADVRESMSVARAIRDRLPLTHTAFRAGDIDLARAGAIVDITASADDDLVGVLESRLVSAARTSAVGWLRETGRRVVTSRDPHGTRRRRERRRELRDVRIRPATDGMYTIDGLLPPAGAQALARRLRELTLQVCGHDPRTLAQRRADAIVLLANLDTAAAHLECECGRSNCPAGRR